MDETPNQHKASILENIKQNRQIIASFTKANAEGEFSESIAILRQEIRDDMKELVELERWRRKEGIEKDEPFKPRSLREKLANMSEDERMEYAEKQAQQQMLIRELEYKMQEGANSEG